MSLCVSHTGQQNIQRLRPHYYVRLYADGQSDYVALPLGPAGQGIAMAVTGKQMAEYHRLQGKLNSAVMQFIDGMPVMKTYSLTAESYKDFAGAMPLTKKACRKAAGAI